MARAGPAITTTTSRNLSCCHRPDTIRTRIRVIVPYANRQAANGRERPARGSCPSALPARPAARTFNLGKLACSAAPEGSDRCHRPRRRQESPWLQDLRGGCFLAPLGVLPELRAGRDAETRLPGAGWFQSRWRSTARSIASARVDAPSFWKIDRRWLFTVLW